MTRRHILAGTLGALALVLGVGTAAAQFPASERIVSFSSDATLQRSGELQVTETIVYDFASRPRHGISRYVPTQHQDPEGNKYYLTFTAGSVTDGSGKKWPVERSRQGGNEVLKIGDPDKTITGRHTYRISYTLDPVVRQVDDGAKPDLFSFNVTGNDWTVPIESASATIRFEPGIEALNTFCYTGPVGSRAADCVTAPAGNGYTVRTTDPLTPGEGLTVANDLKAGSVGAYLEPNPPLWERYNLLAYNGYFVGVLAFLGTGLSWIGGWLYYRWRRSRETEVPQYESPDKLSPAEVGMLIDNRSGMTEVTATLIDLAVRGYLRIEQTEKKGLIGKAKYTFVKRKAATGLSPAEKTLFDAIFIGSAKSVDVSSLDRSKMAVAVSSFQRQVKQELEKKGYYAKERMTVSNWIWLFGAAVLIASGIAAVTAGADLGNLIGQASVAFVGVLFFILSFYRSSMTAAGYVEWGEVAGFRRFLSMTEKERLVFTDAPKRNPKQFSALLPFAVALGVEKEWAKQFAGMNVEKSTASWYHGYHPLNTATIGSDLSSFSGAINSNFAPVSSSSGSSGGSSGGFSGGGSGGGGGGSW